MKLFARLRKRFDDWRGATAERARAASRLHGAVTDPEEVAARQEIRQLSPAARARVEAAIQTGLPLAEIAFRHGLSQCTVLFLSDHLRALARRRLDALERMPRPDMRGGPSGKHDPVREAVEALPAETRARIEAQLQEGAASVDEIAERENVRRAIVRHLKGRVRHGRVKL